MGKASSASTGGSGIPVTTSTVGKNRSSNGTCIGCSNGFKQRVQESSRVTSTQPSTSKPWLMRRMRTWPTSGLSALRSSSSAICSSSISDSSEVPTGDFISCATLKIMSPFLSIDVHNYSVNKLWQDESISLLALAHYRQGGKPCQALQLSVIVRVAIDAVPCTLSHPA